MKIDHSWYIKPHGSKEREVAGGVIVRKENDQLLLALIYDKRFPFAYELPKGGIEKGESSEIAAKREITEEIGLTDIQVITYLGKEERLSFNKHNWAISHYYLFLTKQKEGLPTDHSKEYVMTWVPIGQLPEMFWPEQQKLIENNREKIEQLVQSS